MHGYNGMARMKNRIVPYLIRNGLAGAGIGVLVVAAILVLDIGQVGTLLFNGSDTVVGLILMVWFFALTFASVAMGSAIMVLGHRPKGSDPDKGTRAPSGLAHALVPVKTRQHGP